MTPCRRAARPSTYVLIGPEDVRDRSDKTGQGAEHRLVISVISRGLGLSAAKAMAVAVSDALSDAALALSRGTLVSIGFVRAVARRTDNGEGRRIDLTFRAGSMSRLSLLQPFSGRHHGRWGLSSK